MCVRAGAGGWRGRERFSCKTKGPAKKVWETLG